MNKTRLEAFSDGVIAIIITIMVLELKVPHEATFEALRHLTPVFLSYIYSFVFIAIYWGNHHHLLHTVTHVNSAILWANIHLLFWLSLVPFVTAWMGENNFEKTTIATYSFLLIMCGIAYTFLQRTIMNSHHMTEKLELALKRQSKKGIVSLVCYGSAMAFAFVHTTISEILIIAVSIMWLVPDRNIEQALKKD